MTRDLRFQNLALPTCNQVPHTGGRVGSAPSSAVGHGRTQEKRSSGTPISHDQGKRTAFQAYHRS